MTLFKTLFVMSFLLNSFLCIDLYITVKSPFMPTKFRLKFYIIFSIVLSVTMTTFITKRYGFLEKGR